MLRRICSVFSLLSLLMLSLASVQAQTFYGSLNGNVADATGASLPGARITLTNIGTNEQKTVDSDADGNFQFVNLVPGRYKLDIEKSGFKRYSRPELLIEVQSAVRIDAAMQTGEVTEVLEVTSQTPLLQPETTSLGQVVESRKVLEMPLNGRNVLNLVALVPGVVPQGQSMQNPTGTNVFAWGNYQIGGGQANQSATFIDGGPVNISYGNMTALVPSQDAVQEFRVQTNNLSAEFGRFAGGVINMTSKSGTSQFHGSAYEFLRNRIFNANTFFNNRSGVQRPAFTQNQFGANLSGPIPFLAKDKLFFFFGYEGFRQRQGQSFLLTVPTDAFRNGDFSNLRNAAGNVIPIFDPLTTCGRNNNPACARNAAGAEIITRQQFPNNIIPTSRLDPAARAMARFWGRPNTTGAQFTNAFNFATNASIGGDNDQTNTRIDYNISDKQRLFGRYTRWSNLSLPVDPYKTQTYIDRGPETFTTQQAVIADTYSFSQNLIGDFRISYLRFFYDRLPESIGVDLTTLGLPAAFNNAVSFKTNPAPCVQGFTDVFCSAGTGSIIGSRNDVYSFAPSLTWLRGKHSLKFGGEWRRMTHNYFQSNNPAGFFSFDNLMTSANPFSPAGTGNGFASFMLGYGTTAQVGNVVSGVVTPAPVAAQQIYLGTFAFDTWQVTPRFTLNYGLRWEMGGRWSERFNRMNVFLPDVPSPIAQATGLTNLRGRLGLVNTPERPGRLAQNQLRDLFSPRLGFSFRVTDKAVVRGGYGIFYLPGDIPFQLSPHSSFINSTTTQWVPTLDGGLTPRDVLSNPFPAGILQPFGRNAAYEAASLGQAIAGNPIATEKLGYNQQWNLNVQYEFKEGTLFEIAYSGAKGTNLPTTQQINQLPDQYLSLGTALQEQVPNPFFGQITVGALAARTVARGQLLRPFPQYTGVTIVGLTNRNSTYHAMQLKGERRLRGGASVLVSYTWSKLISDADTLTGWLEQSGPAAIQNFNNLRGEKSVASFDVPHRLVVSYVLDLPFGKGQKLLGNISGVADKFVSGWGVNGVYTAQSGFPLRLTTAANLTNSFGGGSRPNQVNGCNPTLDGSAQSRLTKWFDTACFTAPPAFTFGNVSRTMPRVRTHGVNNFDFTIFKNTKITERVGIQFRTEFFNLFNRAQFGFPGQVFGNPQFGIVNSQVNNPRLVQMALRLIF